MTTVQSFYFDDHRNAWKVLITCDTAPGVGVHLVGLNDNVSKETLLRVVTAMQSCGYNIPGKQIAIIVDWCGAPLTERRSAHVENFDLAIAAAIIMESGQGELIHKNNEIPVFYGSLGLDGQVRDDYSATIDVWRGLTSNSRPSYYIRLWELFPPPVWIFFAQNNEFKSRVRETMGVTRLKDLFCYREHTDIFD